MFEKPGGVVASLRETGVQWDYHMAGRLFNWLQLKGYIKWPSKRGEPLLWILTMVIDNYLRDKTIREKYNVITRD